MPSSLAVAASDEKLNPETKPIQAERKWILDITMVTGILAPSLRLIRNSA